MVEDQYQLSSALTDQDPLLVLKFEFQKFRIFEILNFHPCLCRFIVWMKSSVDPDQLTSIEVFSVCL